MKLLEAEPVVAPEVAPEAPREPPQQQPPSAPEAARTCRSCGAPMQDGQDWCLNCGTAAAGALGQRQGWRAASTVIVITLALVLGAIGASYAALTSDGKKAPAPAPAAAQAQVPATPAPPAQTQPAEPAPTQSTPTTTGTPSTDLPKVKTPKSTPSSASPITPTGSTSTPTPTAPSRSGAGAGSGTSTTPSTTTNQQSSQEPTGPTAIELAGDAGKVYDPYGRVKASGETERALDSDPATSWYVDPKDPQQIGVGYAVDLGKLQGIREIQLQTPTPGFRIEVYATDETEVPPDILDTRWSHITNVSDVAAKGDGKQKIVLGAGSTKYRNLLLWFTQPPTDGPRLRLTELQLLG